MDELKEECGVFGIFGHAEAAKLTYLGLYAVQHRGQESAGIAAAEGGLGIWVARPDGDRVLLVEPRRGRVIGEVRLGR